MNALAVPHQEPAGIGHAASPQALAAAQPAPAAVAPLDVHAAAALAVRAETKQLLVDWVSDAVPQLGPQHDQFTWFLSRRASVVIDKWLASKKFAVLAPLSPTGTGCLVISREAVEHCRDHRALEGVSQMAVVELLERLFVTGSPAYAPNTSKGKHGTGYPNQLAMFDDSYKSIDPTAMGETPVGILQHEGAPFAHLKLITAYWTRPASAAELRNKVLRK